MMQKGMKFVPGKVDEWMDCGNKNVTVETNQRMLSFLEKEGESMIADSVQQENANIVEPCFIGENVVLKNTTVGPFVSVGANTVIENSTIKNSLIQSDSKISNANLDNAMIGNHVVYNGNFETISIGDYSVLE
jgi:glucose-1-phosphate thymidylyltransferase